MSYIGRPHGERTRQPVFNFQRSSHMDADARAQARMQAEKLERQIESGDFEAYMHNLGLDEATQRWELSRAREVLGNRRLAADQDTR